MPYKPTPDPTPSQIAVADSLRRLWERGLLLTPEQLAALKWRTPEPVPKSVTRVLDPMKDALTGKTIMTEKGDAASFTGTVTWPPTKRRPGKQPAISPELATQIEQYMVEQNTGCPWPTRELAIDDACRFLSNLGTTVSIRTMDRFFREREIYDRILIRRRPKSR